MFASGSAAAAAAIRTRFDVNKQRIIPLKTLLISLNFCLYLNLLVWGCIDEILAGLISIVFF